MSAPSFTPGPWSLGRQRKHRIEIDAPKANCKWKDLARVVTRMKGDEPQFDAQGVANASLIAAAPDGFEIIEQLEESFTADGTYQQFLPAMRAYLAKVRGEQVSA